MRFRTSLYGRMGDNSLFISLSAHLFITIFNSENGSPQGQVIDYIKDIFKIIWFRLYFRDHLYSSLVFKNISRHHH